MGGRPVDVLDAAAVRAWASAALRDVAAARAEIDALNVYPVPDGDTGTNLYLTLQSAVEAVDKLPTDADPGEVLGALARGALLGARGNSGVILSQVLRGLADSLTGQGADGQALIAALERASEAAYGAVAEPVEGTMLTVLRAAASAARSAPSVPAVAAAAAVGARDALVLTTDQLDVLRRAGVVDAGGLGICVLLDALEAVVAGETHEVVPARAADPPAPQLTAQHADGGPPYEVMFLIDANGEAVDALRTQLGGVGASVTIAGDGTTWNVHVHADDVDAALAAAAAAGLPRDIRVTSLHDAVSCRADLSGM